MKSIILSFLFITIVNFGFAQTKTEKIKVAGECGMCKTKIEKAAKSAGASYAVWDVDAKELTVKYDSKSADLARIEKSVAAVGYDTQTQKATDEAYNKLHECCKYERTSANEAKADCCKNCTAEKCAECCKDGKCVKVAECCKDGKCEHKSEDAHAAKGDAKSCCKKA
jgi:periplasmic mercuric ion binding protein